MTRERVKQLLPIMQAYAEGKAIQCRSNSAYKWIDDTNPTWEDVFEYRIKPEELKPKRMTYRQLAEWLARGFGEVILIDTPMVEIKWSYDITQQDKEVSTELRIRRWGSDEWIDPTVDVYNDAFGTRGRE